LFILVSWFRGETLRIGESCKKVTNYLKLFFALMKEMLYLLTHISMSEASEKVKPEKKPIHPIIWLSLGAIVYGLLQAFVFPKVSFPS